MAAIKAVATPVGQRLDNSAMTVTWTGVTSADTFVAWPQYPDYTTKSIHVSGVFDSATVVLNGSNTGTNFFGLKNPQGTLISKTTEAVDAVQETMAQYQPSASGGSSLQSLTVTMLFVRATPPRG